MPSSTMTVDVPTNIETSLMMLRKPTELKKVLDTVPKPARAVPKNGLPLWYKLGLETKLPVPKIPEQTKIVFSRGKIGENIIKIGLGDRGPAPTFDLSDPYCNNASFTYVPMHDPHLARHFSQSPIRNRMKKIGFCTKDNRAVCSLKEFNQYRKFLYNLYMDRIHMEFNKLNERAKDDITLRRVDADVARRLQIFNTTEKAKQKLEKVAKDNAAVLAEKKRLAKAHEKEVEERIKRLAETTEIQRKERAAKAAERMNNLKRRIKQAEELKFRKTLIFIRQKRENEKKRLHRLKLKKESEEKRKEDETNIKWAARIESQTEKIKEEKLLMKLYSNDMATRAKRRSAKIQTITYNRELQLAKKRVANWKASHGKNAYADQLVKKIVDDLGKTSAVMDTEKASAKIKEEVSVICSIEADRLVTMGQVRARTCGVSFYPSAVIGLLDEILEISILEFARQRVQVLFGDVERAVRIEAAQLFFKNFRPPAMKKRLVAPRYTLDMLNDIPCKKMKSGSSVTFGKVMEIPVYFPEPIENDLKPTKGRIPTPMPSMIKIAATAFNDHFDDLPDIVISGKQMPKRKKLLEMINLSGKLLLKKVNTHVQEGMDIHIGKVTLPRMKQRKAGEVIECLATALVNHRISKDSTDIELSSQFLTRRILMSLAKEMKHLKLQKATMKPLHVKGERGKTADQSQKFATSVHGVEMVSKTTTY